MHKGSLISSRSNLSLSLSLVKMVGFPQVVHDNSGSIAPTLNRRSAAMERCNFMSGSISNMYVNQTPRKLIDEMDNKEEKKSFKELLKAVELLGSSQMSWKERKKMEDQNVVSLGGKPKKNCRMPIVLGRNIMKKRQNKEQKLFQEGLIDIIPRRYTTSKSQKNRPEDQVLKISEGNFRNGMLDVKHILRKDEAASRVDDHNHGAGKEKRRGKKKQQKGRKRRQRS